MQVHYLKCWPAYYDATVRGDKTFEVRRDDRGYQKGDVVILQRTGPEAMFLHRVETDYHGNAVHQYSFRIGYILTGGQFGIEPGYVVLGQDLSNEGKEIARAALKKGGNILPDSGKEKDND